jgi:hypothetical protein
VNPPKVTGIRLAAVVKILHPSELLKQAKICETCKNAGYVADSCRLLAFEGWLPKWTENSIVGLWLPVLSLFMHYSRFVHHIFMIAF